MLSSHQKSRIGRKSTGLRTITALGNQGSSWIPDGCLWTEVCWAVGESRSRLQGCQSCDSGDPVPFKAGPWMRTHTEPHLGHLPLPFAGSKPWTSDNGLSSRQQHQLRVAASSLYNTSQGNICNVTVCENVDASSVSVSSSIHNFDGDDSLTGHSEVDLHFNIPQHATATKRFVSDAT